MSDKRRKIRRFAAGILFALFALVSNVQAEESGDGSNGNQIQKDSPYEHVGGWLISFGDARIDSAYVCGEYTPFGRWTLAGCGAGAGFLYPQRPAQKDLAHFRLQYDYPIHFRRGPRLELSPGTGLVELQRGRDESGLKFAPGRGPEVREASGGEVSFELELAPVRSGPLRTLRLKGNVGAAWIPDAPAVVPSTGEVLGFFYFTVNGRY